MTPTEEEIWKYESYAGMILFIVMIITGLLIF